MGASWSGTEQGESVMRIFMPIAIAVCVLSLWPLAPHAQAVEGGAFTSYSLSGDVDKNSFGYGGMVAFPFNKIFSVELSGSTFEEYINAKGMTDATMDVISFGASGKVTAPFTDRFHPFCGAGLNYNFFTAEGYRDDTKPGFHVLAGASYQLAKFLDVFCEYRYSFVTFNDGALDTYNFGLVKLGLALHP